MPPEPVDVLHDAAEIEAFFREDPYLHLYEIGDLDPFFRPRTVWFGLRARGEILAAATLYTGSGTPTLLALGGPSVARLLEALSPLLPPRFYAHLSPGLAPALASARRHVPGGLHDKMALLDPGRLALADPSRAVRLGPADAPELQRLYDESYPGNWFDPRMLETGAYRGLREGGALASAGGVHVLSERYRVAALGNVVTRRELRGRGLARVVVAAVCRALLERVEMIGLNVESTNEPAIRCYEALGFRRVAEYEEAWFG